MFCKGNLCNQSSLFVDNSKLYIYPLKGNFILFSRFLIKIFAFYCFLSSKMFMYAGLQNLKNKKMTKHSSY